MAANITYVHCVLSDISGPTDCGDFLSRARTISTSTLRLVSNFPYQICDLFLRFNTRPAQLVAKGLDSRKMSAVSCFSTTWAKRNQVAGWILFSNRSEKLLRSTATTPNPPP